MKESDNSKDYDVIIAGGGLAGLVSAIHLSRAGFHVLVIEKNSYPKHKVCGEYISNEVLPYLESLGFDPLDYGAKRIHRFQLNSKNNQSIETNLPLGGFGISRYTLDHTLAELAQENGAQLMQDTVISTKCFNGIFQVKTKNETFKSVFVIGAFGKRANIDIKLNREFIQKRSGYLAVKQHVEGEFPDDLVALYNFDGGYCGVSRVESKAINVCYITDYKSFGKHKNTKTFEEQVLFKNPGLELFFKKSKPLFDKPLTISQISFAPKQAVDDHVLMCGDSAGLIHPLCGNGMGMAVHSSQIASQLIIDYFEGRIQSRESLEKQYQKAWTQAFKNRLLIGKRIAALFRHSSLSESALWMLRQFPGLLPKVIVSTHGQPLLAEQFG